MSVRLLNAALDEHEGHIVLRGVLDPTTMDQLLTDDYQREIQPVTALTRIMRGFQAGCSVPDVELGMRGHRKQFREEVYHLQDPVYVIDGLQRISAAKLYLQSGSSPHLGAMVHFGTDRVWERNQFLILNAHRTRVSADIILRNFREDYPGVEVLHSLSNNDSHFILKGKVCWEQRRKKTDLVTAMVFAKVTIGLHGHLMGLSSAKGSALQLCAWLEQLSEAIGKPAMKANIKAFFDVVDEGWGLKRVIHVQQTPFVKSTFLLTLARVFSRHTNFWRDERLFVDADNRRKLAQFDVFEAVVKDLASTGAQWNPILYGHMVEHLNKRRRNGRLEERRSAEDSEPVADEPTVVEGGEEAAG
jgi:hypothetical protein